MQEAVTLPISWRDIAVGFLAICSLALNWRFASATSSLKLEFSKQLDTFKKELQVEFVPAGLAAIGERTTAQRIAALEVEVGKNRDRIHELSNHFQALIMGKLDRIEQQLVDKVRRMTNIETRLESMDSTLHDWSARILDMERTRRP